MTTSSPTRLLDEISRQIHSLGLGDGALAWTYRRGANGAIVPGLTTTTGGALRKVPTLLAPYCLLMGAAYRRHIARESLEQDRVSSLTQIRRRTGEMCALFDDEIHIPCGVRNYIRSYVVMDGWTIGFVGVVRREGPRFGAAETAYFKRSLPALFRGMAEAHRLELDLHHEACLVSLQGELLRATRAGRALLRSLGGPDEVARLVAERALAGFDTVDLGPLSLTLSMLSGPQGTVILVRPQVLAPGLASPLDLLTDRQLQVAARVAAGGSLSILSEDLGVTPATVSAHLKTIYSTLGIGCRAELTAMFERRALTR
ncbi:MAG: LuxR family transcriptional regulator [Deltaproteobacteria bacterium]|nr:MAG: LuxR family transcriptional regulator [Deltaproteobacteria bacterium]